MIYILIIIGIFLAEKKIKDYIEKTKEMHKKEEILNGNIILNRYHNKGAFLNIFENNVKFIKALSSILVGLLVLAFVIILPKNKKAGLKLGLSFLLGGAISNTYDRYKRGYVVDYFSFRFLKKIIFNIADLCIFIGSIIIIFASKSNGN